MPGLGIREAQNVTSGKGHCERWEPVAWVEQCFCGHALLAAAGPGILPLPLPVALAAGACNRAEAALRARRIRRGAGTSWALVWMGGIAGVVPVNPGLDQTVAVAGADAESAAWLTALSGTGLRREAALARLHALLVRIACKEVARRGPRLAITGPELDDLAHQAAADALVALIGKLRQFRGESRFTTWAYKFVIFEVSAKIGRHFWRHPTIPLDAEDWERLPARFGFDPAHQAEWRDLFAALRRAVDTELTPRQREVFIAIVLKDVPLDTLVLELRSSRNAIYKMLFDARRKLRAALAANGYLPDESSRGS